MMLWVFFGLEFVCVNIDVVENLECNVLIVVFGGMLGVVVIYIVFINVIVGIVLNMELVNLMVLFGLVFVQMFMLEVGKVIMVLMVMFCCGLLFGWQFIIVQVFKFLFDEGYFFKIFFCVIKVDVLVQGMLIIVIIQSGLVLMIISLLLNSQFNVLVNLVVVINIILYILLMVVLVIIQKVVNVFFLKVKVVNFVVFVGVMYSFYVLYLFGEEVMLYGFIVIFFGWILYGLVLLCFELKNKYG